MNGPAHPPIVRWLLQPLILTAAGAAAGGAWELTAGGWSPGEMLAFGAGLGLGGSACLAATRRRWLRLLLSPIAAVIAQAVVFATWGAIRSGEAPKGWSWLTRILVNSILPLFALPTLALAFCHATYEGRSGSRGALPIAMIAYPALLFPAALVAVIPYHHGSWPFFPYSGCVALVGFGQALGMAAVLRLSAKLAPRP